MRCCPEILSFLIGNKVKWRRLPRMRERIELTDDPLDDFLYTPVTSFDFDEVNLVFRGSSLDHKIIDKSLPTFFLNSKDESDFSEYKNRWLATADYTIFSRFMGFSEKVLFSEEAVFSEDALSYKKRSSGWKVYFVACMGYIEPSFDAYNSFVDSSTVKASIYSYLNTRNINCLDGDFDCSVVIHRSFLHNIQLGSGIGVLVALLNNSRKVNVYGWDQYVEDNLPDSYLKQIKCLFVKKNLSMSNMVTSLINWIYAYRFMRCYGERLKINGYISAVSNFKWIANNAYRVLYNKNVAKDRPG